MGNWNRHFVRVGSDGNVQAFDTKGLEFLKTEPSEQLLSKNNVLDDGSGNVAVLGYFGIGSSTIDDGSIILFNGITAVDGSTNVGGISINGRPRIGDWNNWLLLGDPNGTFNGNILQISSTGIRTGTSTSIAVAPTLRNTLDDGSGNMLIDGKFKGLNSITGAMNGINVIAGSPDLRTGVTAADASAITIFSSTAGGTRYEVKARILATAGSSATYTVSWTEGGVAQKVALTITAVDTEVHDNFVIAPDSGTNITAQITALTSSTVNVDAIVSVLG